MRRKFWHLACRATPDDLDLKIIKNSKTLIKTRVKNKTHIIAENASHYHHSPPTLTLESTAQAPQHYHPAQA